MNEISNYPISLTKMAGREKLPQDNLLYFLGAEMGYVFGYREILDEGRAHGVCYRYVCDEAGDPIREKRYVVYGPEVQKLVRSKAQYIRDLDPAKVQAYVDNDKIVASVYYGVTM